MGEPIEFTTVLNGVRHGPPHELSHGRSHGTILHAPGTPHGSRHGVHYIMTNPRDVPRGAPWHANDRDSVLGHGMAHGSSRVANGIPQRAFVRPWGMS